MSSSHKLLSNSCWSHRFTADRFRENSSIICPIYCTSWCSIFHDATLSLSYLQSWLFYLVLLQMTALVVIVHWSNWFRMSICQRVMHIWLQLSTLFPILSIVWNITTPPCNHMWLYYSTWLFLWRRYVVSVSFIRPKKGQQVVGSLLTTCFISSINTFFEMPYDRVAHSWGET